ncbi:MAG: dienelactone hydrolase family protein [Chloroflexi bacterium]|nr:dienelactone hydrolase family protein [Chloroflexota bacterium]
MWNDFSTGTEGGMIAGVQRIAGGNGDEVHAYIARPDGPGPYPGVVLLHHMPGWDEFYREFSRRFAEHGYIAICPDLYERFGHGTPDDVAARVRGDGGVPDATVIADAEAAMQWVKAQPSSNGKVGVIGTCSGGRHALLVASSVPGFDVVGDLWGGGVVTRPDQATPQRPVAPVELTANLNAPLIGLFGNDDQAPTPEQVNQHEETLKQHGNDYVFYRYDGAGHGFFYYHVPAYRQQQAMDGWAKVLEFFNQHLT